MGYTVGIVGASGAVGQEILLVLEQSSLPISKLRLFGSARSAGTPIESSTKFGPLKIELFDRALACDCDVVFLAVSGSFALEHAEAIADTGTVVIDNSVSRKWQCEYIIIILYCLILILILIRSNLLCTLYSPPFVTNPTFLWWSPKSMALLRKTPS
jgi:aspartate-semialdehyde dehydrogenase